MTLTPHVSHFCLLWLFEGLDANRKEDCNILLFCPEENVLQMTLEYACHAILGCMDMDTNMVLYALK